MAWKSGNKSIWSLRWQIVYSNVCSNDERTSYERIVVGNVIEIAQSCSVFCIAWSDKFCLILHRKLLVFVDYIELLFFILNYFFMMFNRFNTNIKKIKKIYYFNIFQMKSTLKHNNYHNTKHYLFIHDMIEGE